MAIEVTREPAEIGPPHEECFRCHAPTPFWYAPKDVACCQECAALVVSGDVPTKKRWFEECRARDRARRREFAWPHGDNRP